MKNESEMGCPHQRLNAEACAHQLLAVRDALDLVSGKWKIPIIVALLHGKTRFLELSRKIDGIAAKMLSKELQELEMNQLVKRTVCDTKPITVEYELTEYGHSLKDVIGELAKWGYSHRKRIMEEIEV